MDRSRFLVAYIPIAHADRSCGWLTKDDDARYTEIDPIDLPDEIGRRVFELYKRTYAKVSGKSLIKTASGLKKYNRWILLYQGDLGNRREPAASDIVCFGLFTVHPPGLKAGLKGSDGSTEGKKAVVHLATKSYATKDVFGEVSGRMEQIVGPLGLTVPYADAKAVLAQLGKTDVTRTRGDRYERQIGNLGRIEKLMVGRPRVPAVAASAATPRTKKKRPGKKK